MADPIPISLGQGSNVSRNGLEGVAEFVNAYVEELGEGGKVQFPIYAINGLESFATLTSGAGTRAMLPLDSRLLAVAGRLLFSVSAGGVVATVGGIPSDGFVTMARNRRTPNPQVAIVCDGLWFIYEGGTLTQGTDTDLPPPICVVEMDGFFVFLIADGRWFISGIDDGGTIDGLDFSRASTSADPLVMGAARGRDLVLLGLNSTEFHQNTGGEDFPFTLTTSIDMGCFAAGSVANITIIRGGQAADTLMWAATDSQGGYLGIVLLNGYTPAVVSTSEVDRLMRDETDPASIRAMAWTEDGHPFYAISGTSFTRVYDARTGDWHARKSYNSSRWRASCHAQFGAAHIFGDYTTTALYRSQPTVYSEASEPIIWTVSAPPIHMFPHRFRVNAIHIDALTGVGLVSSTEAQANPVLMLDYSRDGGASYGAQRQCALGRAGQRHTRIKERSFGIFDKNGMTLRMSCSANVIKGVLGAAIEADKLSA